MRLGTKILILTLAITLGLAGVIVWVVTRDLTAHETERARADIGRAVSDYFARIDALHQRDFGVVRVLTEDPQNSAQLEALGNGDSAAREHFKLLLGEDLQKYLAGDEPGRSGPDFAEAAFHVVLNFEGRAIFSFAAADLRLAEALAGERIAWPYEPLLGEPPVLTRRYVWVNGRLYLALGIPLRVEISGPPTHGYFIGYRIDNAWATSVLGDYAEQTPLHAWFVADGNVVARGVSGGDDAARDADALGAERAAGPMAASGPPGERRPIAFDAAGERFVGETVAFDLPGDRRGAVNVASSLTRALGPLHYLQATIAWVTAGVVVLAVVAFRFVSNFIAAPVRELVAGTRRVAKGEFDEPIVVNRRDELGELAASFNDMAVGLQQRDLVKSTFGKFVDPKVVEGFLADPSRLMPGGEKRVQTVMFSDLKGFTTMSEKLEPDDLVALLNGHLGDAADVVTETRGIVDKFIGDAVVAFWGPPITGEDEHAGLACAAALRIVRSIRRLDGECARLGVPPLGVRVGVATGEVLVGIIGSANKYDYTVMGDTANLASRLESLNKVYRTNILVPGRTAAAAGRAVLTRRVDRVRVVGRGEAVDVYEVLAERGEEDGVLPLRCEAYAEAMSLYDRRAWLAAVAAFERMSREWPEDGAARAMAERCMTFQHTDPGAEWDGVWNATSK